MTSALWKGKGREEPHRVGPEELDPVITYRHLLSSGLGVRNPLRVIGLCDMDAFYAACEQSRLGIDPSVPLVVRQWDALIAVNYPARTFGISRMDKISSALQRCPDLRVVHVATFDPAAPDAKPVYIDNPDSQTHKVSLDHYRKESKKIIDIFKEVLADAEVERASIDEAFVDLTDPVRHHILTCFPHLSTVPPEGLDAPLPPPPRQGVPLTHPASRVTQSGDGNIWTDLGTLVPISAPVSSPRQDKQPSAPEQHGDVLDSDGRRDDLNTLSFGDRSGSAEVEHNVQDDEQDGGASSDEEEQVTNVPVDLASDEEFPPTWHDIALSIGASMMLRMRDEIKKRLGYTTSAGIARNKFLAKLVASYRKRDTQTILRNAAIPNYLHPLPFQKIRFLGGKLGTAIAEAYDAQTVGDLLSISADEMQHKFGESSIWVWEVLRGIDRSEVKEKSSVTKSMGASKNLQHPITHPSEGAHWLRILAGELAYRLTEAREENPGLWPKTLVLSVRRSYETSQSRQAPFAFTRTVTTDHICKSAEKLWAELVGTGAEYDRNKAKGNVSGMKITNLFLGFSGVAAMAPGQQNIEGFFSAGGKRKNEEDHPTDADSGGKRRKSNVAEHSDTAVNPDNSVHSSKSMLSFRCPRCGKHLRQPVDDHVDHEGALRILKMEHEDFHYAQDLAREGATGSASGTPKKKPKKKVEPKGIAKFFTSARKEK